VEVDGCLEVLSVAEAAGRLLDPLDDRVNALERVPPERWDRPGLRAILALPALRAQRVCKESRGLRVKSACRSPGAPGPSFALVRGGTVQEDLNNVNRVSCLSS
jgi:hypothetical protein